MIIKSVLAEVTKEVTSEVIKKSLFFCHEDWVLEELRDAIWHRDSKLQAPDVIVTDNDAALKNTIQKKHSLKVTICFVTLALPSAGFSH